MWNNPIFARQRKRMNELRQRHGLSIGILLLATATVLSLIVVAFRMSSSLMLDDGYYYMQIAWNISQGNGCTFDGINQTNGFHPLWQFMLVPLFWTGIGKQGALLAAVGLQTVLFISSGWILYALLYRSAGRSLALTAACTWILNPWLWNKAAVSGMETGLLVTCFGVSCWVFMEVLADRKSPWILGISLTFLAAARIDSLPFSLAIVFVLFFRKVGRKALSAVAPLLVYLALYLIINIALFGYPLPVSGYIKSAFGHGLFEKFISSGDPEFFAHAWHNIAEFATLGGLLPLITVTLVPVVLAACGWVLKDDRRAVFSISLFYAVGFFGYYAFMYSSLISLYTYYFIPLLYLAVICTFLCVGEIENPWIHVLAVFIALLTTAAFSVVYLSSRLTLADFTQSSETNPKYVAIGVINHELPSNALIGCWDAGEIGYRANKPVVNLDGLVNNYEYQEFLRTDGLASYLNRVGITYLINSDEERRRIIEETLHWELLYETSKMVPPMATVFSRSMEVQQHKQPQSITYYIFRRPSSRNAEPQRHP
jgi:uncharacterized membrane protein YobD (UPF0266 family)